MCGSVWHHRRLADFGTAHSKSGHVTKTVILIKHNARRQQIQNQKLLDLSTSSASGFLLNSRRVPGHIRKTQTFYYPPMKNNDLRIWAWKGPTGLGAAHSPRSLPRSGQAQEWSWFHLTFCSWESFFILSFWAGKDGQLCRLTSLSHLSVKQKVHRGTIHQCVSPGSFQAQLEAL